MRSNLLICGLDLFCAVTACRVAGNYCGREFCYRPLGFATIVAVLVNCLNLGRDSQASNKEMFSD